MKIKPLTLEEQQFALRAFIGDRLLPLSLEILATDWQEDERRRLAARALADRALLEQLAHYATAVDAAGHRRRERKVIDSSKLLLTKTEVARALGIDRKETLSRLIDSGAIATVQAPKGLRVPRAEIERLIEQGIPKPGTAARPSRRRRPRRPPPADTAAAIRRIPVR